MKKKKKDSEYSHPGTMKNTFLTYHLHGLFLQELSFNFNI